MSEKQAYSPVVQPTRPRNPSRSAWQYGSAIALCLGIYTLLQAAAIPQYEEVEQCSIRNLHETGYYFLNTAAPISVDAFEERRNRLARALLADGADAFVVEPGYTFKYFAIVSQLEWEVWEVGLYPGLTENEIATVLDNTLRSAGMEPFFDIVLFDENAANPHGGTNGSKVLEPETAHLIGYSSDICRSFFPPFLEQPPPDAVPAHLRETLEVWDTVCEAQTQSITRFQVDSSAASIDIAARNVITEAGYGDAFIHRVGHGIGIKDESQEIPSPYLNKGNHGTPLKAGMTFTSEPGVYLVDRFGVRHEDIFLVRDGEEAELLTGQRAKGAWDP
ncbi:Creatinase/aminopeptidase [Aspergillus heteromorphus CBS 117.55]|uniref:Creatinase/aminopeptidase n=1 Tax=Aspergillus heteromorphus CBS 117.55 TaxID=1448321 RepID=A0A317V727_9EURO|nr:Creatinase/aminopeptidase [Aspergillus heteromorphus CBS 117.55]PWY67940.1 Creatinase/aminopeptidase [Aspergillus heteromorphus CBS 117.55]